MSLEVWLWGAAAIGSTIGLGYLGGRVLFVRMRRRWAKVANEFGLTREEAFWYLHGLRDGLFVEVERNGDSWYANVSIRGPAPLLVSIRPRTFGESPTQAIEPDFEASFVVEGDPIHGLALLGHDFRRSWTSCGSRDWTLQGDERGWRLVSRFSMEVRSALRPRVVDALALGRQIAQAAEVFTPEGHRRHLADILVARLSDPSPHVRASACRALNPFRAFEAAVDQALTRALTDPDPAVRLQAALILERPDALARLASDPDSKSAIRLAAFRRAVALAPHETSTHELVRAWVLGTDVGRRLEGLAVLEKVTNEVEALSLEVLTAVERDPDEATLVDLFTLLAKHGTAKSVSRLLPYRDRFFDTTLKVLARDAILAIQARAGGSTGALSISELGGGLSEPE